MPAALAEEARARFVEIAPEGFEEQGRGDEVDLAAYGDAAERVLEAFPDASRSEVESGWEDRWREFHQPVRIGSLWIGPPWHDPPGDGIAVVIDPGRAFGTGAHPTTRLCLELLLEQPAGSVVDVGCGSGVLAIAAAKLGHSPVVAVDADVAAVEATNVNAAANGVAVDARRLDALRAEISGADLALANVALSAVEEIATRMRSSRLVTSGYLVSDRPRVRGLEHATRRELDGWAADLYVRP